MTEKLKGMAPGTYTRADYEAEKATWPPEDTIDLVGAKDDWMFDLCRMRREMIYGLHNALDQPFMRDLPETPSLLGFVKYKIKGVLGKVFP